MDAFLSPVITLDDEPITPPASSSMPLTATLSNPQGMSLPAELPPLPAGFIQPPTVRVAQNRPHLLQKHSVARKQTMHHSHDVVIDLEDENAIANIMPLQRSNTPLQTVEILDDSDEDEQRITTISALPQSPTPDNADDNALSTTTLPNTTPLSTASMQPRPVLPPISHSFSYQPPQPPHPPANSMNIPASNATAGPSLPPHPVQFHSTANVLPQPVISANLQSQLNLNAGVQPRFSREQLRDRLRRVQLMKQYIRTQNRNRHPQGNGIAKPCTSARNPSRVATIHDAPQPSTWRTMRALHHLQQQVKAQQSPITQQPPTNGLHNGYLQPPNGVVPRSNFPSASVPTSVTIPLPNGAVASSAMQRSSEPLSSFAQGSTLMETLRAMIPSWRSSNSGINSNSANAILLNPTEALPPRIPGRLPSINPTAPTRFPIPALPPTLSAASLLVPNSQEMKDVSEEDESFPPYSLFGRRSSSAFRDEVMSADELKNLIKQNERTADATEEAPTPPELTVELMPHQRRALAWMSKREEPQILGDDDVVAVDDGDCLGGILADDQGLGKTLTLISLFCKKNPKWEDTKAEKRKTEVECVETAWKVEQKVSSKRKSREGAVEFVDSSKKKRKYEDDPEFSPKSPLRPRSRKKEAPIVLDSDSEESPPAKDSKLKPRNPWQTLIVCPVSLLNQWKAEIEDKMKPQYRPLITMYHGSKRERDPAKLAKYDIVLTTYQTLTLEYPKVLKDHPAYEVLKKEKKVVPCRKSGPVFKVRWDRVVLDEAQYVKNRGTDCWSAVMALKARKRWCATGTPIQNTVDDLYSLFRFIRYTFVKNYHMWNDLWKKKLEHSSPAIREAAFKRFQTIVGVVLLRRTKMDTINGSPLICLPARNTIKIEAAFQDPEEMRVYHAVRDKSVVQFNKYLLDGSLLQNYRGILLMLLRLRQACSHPFLIQYADMNQSSALSTTRMTKFDTPYSVEELKEAMELIAGGHPHLDLIDVSSRKRVIDMLGPVLRGDVVHYGFQCESCGRYEQWTRGAILPCGHLFCESCCTSLRGSLKCSTCHAPFEDPNVSDVFICPNDLRREIHAKKILSSGYGPEKICTPAEFKAWISEEIDVRRKQRGSLEGSIEKDLTEYQTQHKTPGDAQTKTGADGIVEVQANIKVLKALEPENKEESPKERLISAFAQPSTKIREILYQLARIRKKAGNEKTLIFSQWTSMLDIVEFHVRVRGYGVCRLDGSMSASARHQQVDKFKIDENNTVFLISLHAGGIGLNLTEACNVILCDVWWNPASEDQAIDRVHRIGQRKDVTVFRFEMKDTVERKIYEICKRKKEASDGALGVTGAQSLGRKKLSPTELMQIFRGAAENTLDGEVGGNSEATAAARNILRMQQNFAAF